MVSESQPLLSTFSILGPQPQATTFVPPRSQAQAPIVFLSGSQPQVSTQVTAQTQPRMPVFTVSEPQLEEVPVLVTAQSQPQVPTIMVSEPQVPVFIPSRPQQQVPVFRPSQSRNPVTTTVASQSQQLPRVVSLPPEPVVASIPPEVPLPVVVVADSPSTSPSVTTGVQFQRVCDPVSHPLVDDTLDEEVFHFSWLHDGGREYNWQEAADYCRSLGHGFHSVSLETSRKDSYMAAVLLAREYLGL